MLSDPWVLPLSHLRRKKHCASYNVPLVRQANAFSKKAYRFSSEFSAILAAYNSATLFKLGCDHVLYVYIPVIVKLGQRVLMM